MTTIYFAVWIWHFAAAKASSLHQAMTLHKPVTLTLIRIDHNHTHNGMPNGDAELRSEGHLSHSERHPSIHRDSRSYEWHSDASALTSAGTIASAPSSSV